MRTVRVLVAAAVLLVVAGAVVVVTAPAASFGWFAYAPLSGEVHEPPSLAEGAPLVTLPLLLGGQELAGAGIVVLGLVVAGAALGVRLGRRLPP